MAAPEISLKGRKDPQISANDLALYMVSSATAQLSIIRRNKYPSKHVVGPYQDVKRKLINFLASDIRDKTELVAAIESYAEIEKNSSLPTSKIEDARLSKAVLEAFFAADNILDLAKIKFVDGPRSLPPLMVSGVKVTTSIDLLTRAVVRNVEHGGGAILRLTRAEDGEAAKDRRERMGDFVAALVFMQIDDKRPGNLPPLPRICLAIDVQHQKKYEARAGSRRISDLNSACSMIASVWPTV